MTKRYFGFAIAFLLIGLVSLFDGNLFQSNLTEISSGFGSVKIQNSAIEISIPEQKNSLGQIEKYYSLSFDIQVDSGNIGDTITTDSFENPSAQTIQLEAAIVEQKSSTSASVLLADSRTFSPYLSGKIKIPFISSSNTVSVQITNITAITSTFQEKAYPAIYGSLINKTVKNLSVQTAYHLPGSQSNPLERILITFNDSLEQSSLDSITVSAQGLQLGSPAFSDSTRKTISVDIFNTITAPTAVQITGGVGTNEGSQLYEMDSIIVYPSNIIQDEGFSWESVVGQTNTSAQIQYTGYTGTLTKDNTMLTNLSGQSIAIQSFTKTGNEITITYPAIPNNEKYILSARGINAIKQGYINIVAPKQYSAFITRSEYANGVLTLFGEHLDQITSVSLAGNRLSQTSQNPVQYSGPALSEGQYDLIITQSNGSSIVKEDAVIVSNSSNVQFSIDSEQSYASPRFVRNDGSVSTIWVKIHHNADLGSIQNVYLDLRPVNKNAVTPMVGINELGNIVTEQGARWFKYDLKLDKSVIPSNEPYKIPVTARDTYGNTASGYVDILVVRDIAVSSLPEVLQAYSSPQLLEKSKEFVVTAYVKDNDGYQTIDTVIADLSSLGLAPARMKLVTETVANSQEKNTNVSSESSSSTTSTTASKATAYYQTDPIVLRDDITNGKHEIGIIVTDIGGQEVQKTVEMTVTNGRGIFFEKERFYVYPTQYVTNDGSDTFSVSAYVTDPDGLSDVESVEIDLNEIGGGTRLMQFQGSAGTSQKGGVYILEDISVPQGTTLGGKSIYLYAHDKQGNTAREELRIQVTLTNENGRAPIVASEESYTIPAVLKNDGNSKTELHVFIKKQEFPVEQVLVELGNIASFEGEMSLTHDQLTENAENICKRATKRTLCMIPGLKEGDRGQWFTLPEVVVDTKTASSLEAYRVRIIATDESGKVGEGFIPLVVGDGTLPQERLGFPKVVTAVSVGENRLELVFSNPIDPSKITLGAFKVTKTVDTSATLALTRVVSNADATIVTIDTETQISGESYTLFANAKMLGLKEDQYTDNFADFTGYEARDIPPQLIKVTPLSNTLIELVFSEGIKPTSLLPNGKNFEIFTLEAKPSRLRILHAEMSQDTYTLHISTDKQLPRMYTLRAKDLVSPAGVPVGGNDREKTVSSFGIHKYFQGFKAEVTGSELKNRADLNQDGKVDFQDFTLFGSVYMTSETNGEPTATEGDIREEYQPSTLRPVIESTTSQTSNP